MYVFQDPSSKALHFAVALGDTEPLQKKAPKLPSAASGSSMVYRQILP